MRTATTIEASQQDTWSETLDFVLEAEKLGLDICWVAEAGVRRALTPGILAARTDRAACSARASSSSAPGLPR